MIQPMPNVRTPDQPSSIMHYPELDSEPRNGTAGARRSQAARDVSAKQAEDALAKGEGAGSGGVEGEVDTAILCRLLSLLADKTRLRILWLLARGERAVGAMTAELRLPQPTVSHHLAWLRTMHLVSPRRAGKNVFYTLGRAARVEADGSLSLLTADTVITLAKRADR